MQINWKDRAQQKGSLRNPDNKRIVSYLEQHGAQTFDQLSAVFKEPTRFRINSKLDLHPRPEWLRGKLVHLRSQGSISRVILGNVVLYQAGSEARAQRDCPAAPPQYDVTPPRRVYVMGTPDYSPPKATPYRAGALDFAACPSVHAGRTVPFKTDLEADHG